MTFDYTATDTPDDVVRSVAAEMSGGGLKPLSDSERLEREIWREEQRQESEQREEKRRIDRERRRAEQVAETNRQAAIVAAQERQKAQRERSERIDREVRQREMRDLQFKSAQQQAWQADVETAARIGLVERQRRAILDELDALAPPPSPGSEAEPEPEPAPEFPPAPKIGDPDFFEKWRARSPLRSWWFD